jgi:hypothetical protein
MISHLLSQIPYERITPPEVDFPERPPATDYERPPLSLTRFVPDVTSSLRSSGKKKH